MADESQIKLVSIRSLEARIDTVTSVKPSETQPDEFYHVTVGSGEKYTIPAGKKAMIEGLSQHGARVLLIDQGTPSGFEANVLLYGPLNDEHLVIDDRMEYQPNTADQLRHYFVNQIDEIKLQRQIGVYDTDDEISAQREFEKGMELTLQKLAEGKLVETKGIGETQLRRILGVVTNSNFTQSEDLRRIYEVYSEITGKKFDKKFYAAIK